MSVTETQPIVVARRFLALVGGNASSEDIAALFAEDADFFLRGDAANAPWLGRRGGRSEIARFIDDLRAYTETLDYDVEAVVGNQDIAIVYGTFRTRVRRTGKTFESEFAYVLKLRDGLIAYYRVLEDSLDVSRAAR